MRKESRLTGLRWIWVIVLAVFVVSAVGSKVYAAEGEKLTGNINAFIGKVELNDDWEPAEEGMSYGIEIDAKMPSWPVGFVVGYSMQFGDGELWGLDFDTEISEITAGIRKTWEKDRLHPFIGGGICHVTAKMVADDGIDDVDDDDAEFGYWVSGGAYWTLESKINVGLEIKYSTAPVNVFDLTNKTGAYHYGALVGFHF